MGEVWTLENEEIMGSIMHLGGLKRGKGTYFSNKILVYSYEKHF